MSPLSPTELAGGPEVDAVMFLTDLLVPVSPVKGTPTVTKLVSSLIAILFLDL